MYTGILIDDLVARVERAETSVRVRAEHPNSENWSALTLAAMPALEVAAQLRGVA